MIGDEDRIKVYMNAAAGVVVKNGENDEKLLLLIRRSPTDHFPRHWEFPRGKCDKGKDEDLLKCLKREVKEETGLDVIPKFLIDTFEYLADKGTRKTKCFNYYCVLKNPDQAVKLSKEHDKFKWIQSVGEAEVMMFPDQKKTVEKVFNKDMKISTTPENDFTKNNKLEEYLNFLHRNSR